MIRGLGKRLSALRAALPDVVSDRRGVVLIAVLWICALIMWFALQISAETRLQGEDQILSIRKSQALYLATGGCFEALARMGQPPPLRADEAPGLNWQPDGKPRLVEYHTGRAIVIIEPEDRKVNVNKAGQPQLKQILERAGADEISAERLTDIIMDFIDQDDTPRMHGAEDSSYKKSGHGFGPFNGELSSLDQLLLVPGVTQQLFYGYGREGGRKAHDVPEVYNEFVIPGKYSLFSLLTVYGSNANPSRGFQDEETDPRPVSWAPNGVYRILSFGMSANGPPSVGVCLIVRFSPLERGAYKVLSRKIL
ncbi:MAG: hypothetical protein WAW37_01610 [Syntrophobacteraceae bacterium]